MSNRQGYIIILFHSFFLSPASAYGQGMPWDKQIGRTAPAKQSLVYASTQSLVVSGGMGC